MLLDDGTEKEISEDLKALTKRAKGKCPDKFINYVRFPNFKNIEPNTEIKFEFPLTVIVGANGTGKSSVLSALYGMPDGKTTEDFWFSTSLDAIEEGGPELGQHRYIYGHHFEGRIVETRKARVSRPDRSLDYWEPTKAVVKDGMPAMPPLTGKQTGRSKDRWNPVKKSVLFLNFKSELSAYDKYMYFGRERKLKQLASKQDLIRRDSAVLKRIIQKNDVSYDFFGRPVASEVRKATEIELRYIKKILGREYISATLIRHRLFDGNDSKSGLSVIFENKTLSYSEAHAGSGEVAIVSAVIQILAMKKDSLILLDEPEVSLHPGAQRRLLSFIIEQIKVKSHQVVLSTHSPEFVRSLPPSALKAMKEGANGRFQILESVNPSLAFQVIGSPISRKLTVYVEDAVAAILVEEALRDLDPAEQHLVEVIPHAGGAESILCHAVPVWMNQSARVLVYLDGDKRPENLPPHSNEIPSSMDPTLGETISKIVGGNPHLHTSGSANPSSVRATFEAQRKFLDWFLDNVRFLPRKLPEEIIVNAKRLSEGKERIEVRNSSEVKQLIQEISGLDANELPSAESINIAWKISLREFRNSCAELQEILACIKPLIENLEP